MDRQSKNNTPILAPSGTLPVPRLWTPSHRRMLQSASSREISWAKNALQDMTMIWHDDTPQESYVFLKAMEDQLGLGKVRMHPASMGKQSQEVKSLLKLLSPAIWPEWSTQERITKAFWISQWAESTVTPICLSKNERTDVNGQPPDDSWPAIQWMLRPNFQHMEYIKRNVTTNTLSTCRSFGHGVVPCPNLLCHLAHWNHNSVSSP